MKRTIKQHRKRKAAIVDKGFCLGILTPGEKYALVRYWRDQISTTIVNGELDIEDEKKLNDCSQRIKFIMKYL